MSACKITDRAVVHVGEDTKCKKRKKMVSKCRGDFHLNIWILVWHR